MPVLRLFAQAREAAGTGKVEMAGTTVADVLASAVEQFGPVFADVVSISAVWVNGQPATPANEVGADDEVALLPPVSGGSQ